MSIEAKPTTVQSLYERFIEPQPSDVELRFPQKLRAAAAGAVFAACRPSFTPEDEGELGLILGQLAGWVLHGNAYDPDLPGGMGGGLRSA